MSHVELRPGDLLEGRYELLRKWSSGGMGVVWLARVRGAAGFEKLFAIKTLLPQFTRDASFRAMFIDEARIITQIRHGNVVGVEHLGEHQGTIYLALEWVQGGSWAALIDACHRVSTVPGDIMLRIAAGACAGLHAAHELRSETGAPLNVVHRDVSPQNVLITEAGTTKLIDFGIAKSHGRSSEKTEVGMLKAKLEYASPEQVTFQAVDRRADLWGLGVVLYYAFAGCHPFDASNDLMLMEAIASGRMRPVPPHVPPRVADVIRLALQPDPAARFQTAADMKSAIESCITAPTSPETVAACLREFLQGPLAQRRHDIRVAIEEMNRRSSPSLEGVAGQGSSPGRGVAMPVLPPELAQREWADSSPSLASQAGLPDDTGASSPGGDAIANSTPRMSPALWAAVIAATLLAGGVWARVVMLGLEMRNPVPASFKTSSAELAEPRATGASR